MDTHKNFTSQNQSVMRAFSILEYLAKVGSPKELSTIGHDLGMNKSTVYRFLSTLEELGYVRQDAVSGRYLLGSKVVWIASRFLEGVDLRSLARPVLEETSAETGETVHLAILDNYEVVYIDKIEGRQPVKMASQVGGRMPAHSTGLGKALLAYQSEAYLKAYIQKIGLTRYTPTTITDPEAFLEHMRMIQARGYSIDDSENEQGICCVAVPVKDHSGKTVAAISISGWTMSMNPERATQLAPLAKAAAERISSALGFLPAENNTRS